jgi:hypothetical protein
VKISIYQGKMLINEIEGKGDAGINKILWNMTKRRERTEEEKKIAREQIERMRAAGFRRGRVDPNFISGPASEGEYKIVLSIGDKKIKKIGKILKDVWTGN